MIYWIFNPIVSKMYWNNKYLIKTAESKIQTNISMVVELSFNEHSTMMIESDKANFLLDWILIHISANLSTCSNNLTFF